MAISRMQQPRQMYGLGSFVKKAVRKVTKPFTKVAKKIVPKEVAGIMRVAAPFLPAGYREAAYLLGTAKQTGRISPIDLALTLAPSANQYFASDKTLPFGQRQGFFAEKLPGANEFLFGAPAEPSGINLIDPAATAEAGKNIRLIPDAKETTGIFGTGGKMFQFGKDQGSVLDNVKAFRDKTKLGSLLLEGDKGTFSKSKVAGLGVGVLSLIQNSKTPDEAGQALAASTGNSDDYDRGFQLFSQIRPELFGVPEEFRMNVKDGGIMRTNYSQGSDFITKRPNFFKDLFLEREGGGGKDYMLPMEAGKRKDLTEGMIFGADDMAKAEELEAEKILPSLYNNAMLVIDAIQDIDDEETKMKMINDVNSSFDKTRGSGLSKAANSYYRIIQKYGYLLDDKKRGLGSMKGRPISEAKDGGIMRINYSRGSDDKPVLPEDPTKPINPFGPKPIKPLGDMKMSEFDLLEYQEEFERVFPDMREKRGTDEYNEMLEDYFRGLASKDDNKGIMMAGSDRYQRILEQLMNELEGRLGRELTDAEYEMVSKEAYDRLSDPDFAVGGRVDYALGTRPTEQESGLGGLPIEADMRYTGGFMPYGAKEKADDVPARLSKNEFVFTADAVRAAGGGSVNQGAKKMYQAMKQLEAKPEAKGMTA